MKVTTLSAIRDLKGLKGSLPISYSHNYQLDVRRYKCSDSFCARYTPSQNHIAHFCKDFLGFTVVNYDNKRVGADFSIEEEFPEFFRICQLVEGVQITHNSVTTLRKTDAWFLFKLLRHYMWDYSTDILKHTIFLMDQGYSFFTSYILTSYSHYYAGGKNYHDVFNGRFLMTLIGDNYVLYNNQKPHDSTLPIIYGVSVKDFLDIFAKTHILSACYLGSYNVRPEDKKFFRSFSSMSVSFSAIYHLTDKEYIKQVVKDCKKFKELIKAEKWKEAAEMMKIKAKYWD